ncbi:MAG: branched-chain amino acid ABC transporter permease [Betaproteobacteria bacterium]|nr:branched-chain amino acid ABC transporter permease [Betaproteobacteria bacterium]
MSEFTIVLDGIAYGMVLFIISVGLTVTMGLMRVVNLAHGSFAMIGGYVAAVAVGAGVPFIAAAFGAALVAGLTGALAEVLVYRPLYRKGELAQALMTFGFTFVVIAALTAIFGTSIKTLPLPEYMSGLVDIGFRMYPAYRLFLIAFGLALALALWLGIDRSLYGARLRTAVDNPRMAGAVGINVNRLFQLTFAGGCALAGLGGVVGSALLPLEPYYALRYLVLFLVVVGVGGVGNFKGSFVAAISLGVIDTVAKYFLPSAAAYLFYGAVLALLLWRPDGLMPARSAQ